MRIPATRVAEMLVTRLMALLDGGPPQERGLACPAHRAPDRIQWLNPLALGAG